MAQPHTIYVDSWNSESEAAASQKRPLWANQETAVLSIRAEILGPHRPHHPSEGDWGQTEFLLAETPAAILVPASFLCEKQN